MKKLFLIIAIIVAGTIIFIRWNDSPLVGSAPYNVVFSPFPPADIDGNATPEQLAAFAWNEFLALNWKSSYNENKMRDYPDISWSYNLPYPNLTVWETYAHKTELRPYSDKMLPFDSAPHYSYGIMPQPYPNALETFRFTLFNNLDENNEIGSCNVYGNLGERPTNLVLYQAKVNRAEYEYILKKYPTKDSLRRATDSTRWLIKNPTEYYKTGAPCNCASDRMIVSLPCGAAKGPDGTPVPGTIEIKTAWMLYNYGMDTTRYITRRAISYYRFGNQVYYTNRLFVLVGMHIIHKTQNYPAFIFATFEQEDLQDYQKTNIHHTYVELNDSGYEIPNKAHPDYPRLRPISDIAEKVSDYAHARISAKNPKSPLLHYRLIGVQANPEKDGNAISQFLANYIVESDSTLGRFRGSDIGHPHDNGANTLYHGKLLVVTGCQGCHGAAQLKLGTDLSFLLDTVGKPALAPDGIFPKRLAYIRAFKAAAEYTNTAPKK
ncbi:hypothetical protein [Chitinophaga sp. RAB17]|uniref:hypothetical protein n=1 Tax=Chitinophaga sp. RAB17 TaxID=3233049 RepID=UPI003F8F5E20